MTNGDRLGKDEAVGGHRHDLGPDSPALLTAPKKSFETWSSLPPSPLWLEENPSLANFFFHFLFFSPCSIFILIAPPCHPAFACFYFSSFVPGPCLSPHIIRRSAPPPCWPIDSIILSVHPVVSSLGRGPRHPATSKCFVKCAQFPLPLLFPPRGENSVYIPDDSLSS